MSIRYFCDGCGQEITDKNACHGGHILKDRLGATLERNGRKLKVEVLIETNGTSNTGDWCKYCVLFALNQLDDRPRQKPESPEMIALQRAAARTGA
jgi:hypothetical protein